MPIRFRCEHCNQLLGIARRKAGTWVNCPTCRNNVLVPASEELPRAEAMPPLPPEPDSDEPAPAGLFERDDFDVILAGGGPAPVSMPPARLGGAVHTPPPVLRPGPSPALSSSQWPGAPPPGGLVLSPGRATMLTVVLILLLAVSFVAGLLVGRFAL